MQLEETVAKAIHAEASDSTCESIETEVTATWTEIRDVS
jgi:hypothetical protein